MTRIFNLLTTNTFNDGASSMIITVAVTRVMLKKKGLLIKCRGMNYQVSISEKGLNMRRNKLALVHYSKNKKQEK